MTSIKILRTLLYWPYAWSYITTHYFQVTVLKTNHDDKAACVLSVVQNEDSRDYGVTQSWLLQVGSSENRNLSLSVHDSTITRLSHHANSTGRSITTVKRVEPRSQNVGKRNISSVVTKLIWSSPLNLCMIRDTPWGLSLLPFVQSQTYWRHFD
jgi:hypothetical protein